jgi:hypothetical protein
VSFSDAFWPAFLATAAGVVLGIPAGLGLAWLARRIEKRARRKETTARTCEALDALVEALRSALPYLRRIPDEVHATKPKTAPLIIWRPKQAIWEMLSPVVREGVEDAWLKVRLARCFEVVQGIAVLLDKLNDVTLVTLGPDPMAIRMGPIADQLRDVVTNRANYVAVTIEEVCSEADAYLKAHRPTQRGAKKPGGG